MQLKEIIAVYSDNHTKIEVHFVKKIKDFCIPEACTYCYHRALLCSCEVAFTAVVACHYWAQVNQGW